MDYRMYSGGASAGENVVTLIKNELYTKSKIQNQAPLKFIGFEGTAGTLFTLNNQKDKMAIPSSGKFITPYNGTQYCPIYSLVFDDAFSGYIYYIM